jgi:hypothetical protein
VRRLAFQNLDRHVLIIYCIALLALMLLPVAERNFRLLGIGSDKWVHVALMAGCSMLLRFNLAANSRGTLISIGVTVLIAAGIEVAQGLTGYRDPEWGDVLAGFVGAVLGALVMNRILASPTPNKLVGMLTIGLGVMVAFVSILVDVFRASDAGRHGRMLAQFGSGHSLFAPGQSHFGPMQVAGTVLGALLIVGGVLLYRKRLTGKR